MSATRTAAAKKRPRPRSGLTWGQLQLLVQRLEEARRGGHLVLPLPAYVGILAAIAPEEFAEPPGCAEVTRSGRALPGTPAQAALLCARRAHGRRRWQAMKQPPA
jgi:hypothetical protein